MSEESVPPPPDPFFALPADSTWNACIGAQGDEQNYIDGYMEAAIDLAQGVLVNKAYGKRDTLAMPILFTARHAVELLLKFSISRLHELGVLPSAHRKDHDILSHWSHLAGNELGDEFLYQQVAALERYVGSLANIDEDGQELRYHQNRDGEKSMQDKALANIAVIAESLTELQSHLRNIQYRILDLEEERRTGTFTNKCSRVDLIAISKLLPAKALWDCQDFVDAKEAIMKRFGLGSRQFSKALDAIQGSRELAVTIGISFALKFLTDEHAIFVLRQWQRLHPPRANEAGTGIDYFDRDWNEIAARHEVEGEVYKLILETLSPQEFADIETIYYIGRDSVYGEHYEARVERTSAEYAHKDDISADIQHVMTKTNFADCLLNGLRIVGRPDLAEDLGRSTETQPC